MPRIREGAARSPTPESFLQKATLAKTAGLRAKYARRGLDGGTRVDRTTRAMLLRQLYLSFMERRRFDQARELADEMVELAILPDVAHHDAARACLGLSDIDGAALHLRLAARLGPPSRRAFHFWTLGSVLYLNRRVPEAIRLLESAARWGTRDKPLYRAQLALAQLEAGIRPAALGGLRDQLELSPCAGGYGQYVLGELCVHLGDDEAAIEYLSSFVERTTSGRVALAVALSAEIRRARQQLLRLRRRHRLR
jgi:tetratricopeptide (TPR) repeat protein